MPAPAIAIWLERELARRARILFARFLQTRAPLRLGVSSYPGRYQAYRSSAGHSRYRYRHNWNRKRLPLYGSPSLTIPVSRVIVPAGLSFIWDNASELPQTIPSYTLAETRNRNYYQRAEVPVPSHELIAHTAPPRTGGRTRGPPPEQHRRRHDAKTDYGLNRLYRLNHMLHSADEYLEVLHAFQNNHTPMAIATALAMNQAIDVAYGRRGRFLRDKIYRNPEYWTLPVGYDTLSRIWRN